MAESKLFYKTIRLVGEMIISHKNTFIFIKTNKTAGTSIEIALSSICGPNDIIPPISQEDEEVRKALGYRGPQNYLSHPLSYNIKDVARFIFKRRRKRKFFSHISAGEIKRQISPQIWDSYFKFCFERNPWDRVVSLYNWLYQMEPRPSFSEFVWSDLPLKLQARGIDLYTIDGEIAVDKICRFENLAEELDIVCTNLGFTEKLNLPKAKSRFRKNSRNYRDIYTEEEKARIGKLFSREISMLGYEF